MCAGEGRGGMVFTLAVRLGKQIAQDNAQGQRESQKEGAGEGEGIEAGQGKKEGEGNAGQGKVASGVRFRLRVAA